ncbi:MAG: TetR/AcrR family transcriptional regulator [Rectinemataceae bacterium]
MKGKVLDKRAADRIKGAAKEIFLVKGYDGATMQVIADLAGVNKAQLHYYFRSKDSLFMMVFREEFQAFLQTKIGILRDEKLGLRQKLELWIDAQGAFLSAQPQLPLFIVTEINRNPGLIQGLMAEMKLQLLSGLLGNLGKDPAMKDSGVTLEELMTMMVSLLVFPLIAAPMFQLLLGLGPEGWARVQARQTELAKELIRRYLP